MSRSIFSDIRCREIYGNRKYNACCVKRIPEFGIEYFECRSTQSFRLHSMVDMNSPPFSCDYSPRIFDYLLIAQEDGLVHLYDTTRCGPRAFIQAFEAHSNAVFDVKWLLSGTEFLTASGDQSIRLTDAEHGIVIRQFFGHTMSVRCLTLMPDHPRIFASASRDGSVRLWDSRLQSNTVNSRGNPGTSSIAVIPQCHIPIWPSSSVSPNGRRPRISTRSSISDAHSVTSVVFASDITLLSSGSSDGSIKMWDLRRLFCGGTNSKPKQKNVLQYQGVSQKRIGYSDLRLNSLRTRLYANCLDNVVYEYDLTQTSTYPFFVYSGHQTGSFYIKLDVSPDDNYIVCGSSDRRAHIYAVGRRRQRPVVLSGHSGEVSVPRWCPHDPTRLVTLSDDSMAFIWNMFPARRCILPQPNELAGLAERLSPAKVFMSPNEQNRRLLRPRSSVKRPDPSLNPSTDGFSVSPSPASCRRRQSTIRCFLEAIATPENNQTTKILHVHPQPIAGKVRARTHTTTLSETLGGVIQRFPGFSTLSSPPSAVTPFGCYLPGLVDRNPSSPVPRSNRGILTPEKIQNNSDSENVSPVHSRSQTITPIDFTDPVSLTKSPIICVSNRSTSTPETPPAGLRKRTPLGLRQALFTASPPARAVNARINDIMQKRTGSTEVPSTDYDQNENRQTSKRRRLTVLGSGESSTKPSTPASPITAASRSRRMTTIGTRLFRPITEYFKSDELL